MTYFLALMGFFGAVLISALLDPKPPSMIPGNRGYDWDDFDRR